VDWPAWSSSLPEPDVLWRRSCGDVVTDHRSSWVRRLAVPSGSCFVKTYEYQSWASRLRDCGKRTAPWAAPRAVREFDALAWLRQHDFAAPEPLAALVWRRFGFVARATLVTAAFAGTAADALLPALPTAERIEAARAIGAFVQRLHRLGFRDRNLDLRNLLLAPATGGFRVAKIDSGRFRVVHPGAANDRLARDDWLRLAPQLRALGIEDAARDGARDAQPAD
jgi:hypothetical protein